MFFAIVILFGIALYYLINEFFFKRLTIPTLSEKTILITGAGGGKYNMTF